MCAPNAGGEFILAERLFDLGDPTKDGVDWYLSSSGRRLELSDTFILLLELLTLPSMTFLR